jgi:hypothetical protein
VDVFHNGITANFRDKSGDGKPEREENLLHEVIA